MTLGIQDILSINQLSKYEKFDRFCGFVYSKREGFVGEDVSDIEFLMNNLDLDYTIPTRHRENIVFFAIETLSPSILKLLIDKGVSTKVVNSTDESPLDYARRILQNHFLAGMKLENRIVQLNLENISILANDENEASRVSTSF